MQIFFINRLPLWGLACILSSPVSYALGSVVIGSRNPLFSICHNTEKCRTVLMSDVCSLPLNLIQPFSHLGLYFSGVIRGHKLVQIEQQYLCFLNLMIILELFE